MGTLIEAVGIARPRRRLGGTGAIVLADRAAEACLASAGRAASELDLLVNAGVYHDNNLYEPALAAIIQEDIAANPAPTVRGGHGTFSFDVNNGACGVVTGMQIVDGFLASRAIDLGMVVASDADPGLGSHWDFPFGLVGTAGRLSRPSGGTDFPFAPVGGAVLLARTDDDRGLARFAFATFPEHDDQMTAAVAWEKTGLPTAVADRVPGLAGTNLLQVREAADYANRGAECAASAARSFLDDAGLGPRDLDLLVPSPSPPGFADRLARYLELPPNRVARVDRRDARAHTAGPLVAFEAARERGQLAGARNVLFAAVGAGITVALALYHP
jgi:3-oxoacyl-[acyl-carrier-protein] synthase-3